MAKLFKLRQRIEIEMIFTAPDDAKVGDVTAEELAELNAEAPGLVQQEFKPPHKVLAVEVLSAGVVEV